MSLRIRCVGWFMCHLKTTESRSCLLPAPHSYSTPKNRRLDASHMTHRNMPRKDFSKNDFPIITILVLKAIEANSFISVTLEKTACFSLEECHQWCTDWNGCNDVRVNAPRFVTGQWGWASSGLKVTDYFLGILVRLKIMASSPAKYPHLTLRQSIYDLEEHVKRRLRRQRLKTKKTHWQGHLALNTDGCISVITGDCVGLSGHIGWRSLPTMPQQDKYTVKNSQKQKQSRFCGRSIRFC